MKSNDKAPKPRGSDRRAGDRRQAERAFAGEDRRAGERRSGSDRRDLKHR